MGKGKRLPSMQKYANTGEIITTFSGQKQRIFVGVDKTLFAL